jgi:hypothetical protein
MMIRLEIDNLRTCPTRLAWLKLVSFDRILLKGEAPIFENDFDHSLSCERPFKCQRHLIEDLECGKFISNLSMNPW